MLVKCFKETYVIFLDGWRNDLERKVETRDHSKIQVPAHVYGFQFFDVFVSTVRYDGREIEMRSKNINISGIHYYGGELYTLQQMKSEFPNEERIIECMEKDGPNWNISIHSPNGKWYRFNDKDKLVSRVI